MITVKKVMISHYGILESYSNGKTIIYYNNDKKSTRDELNNIYRLYKNGSKVSITTKEIDKEVLLNNL